MDSNGVVLGDLLDGLPAEQAALPVAGLALDSRRVQAGDVFLAVPGHTTDGRDHIEQACAAGAVAVIAQAPCDASQWRTPLVEVDGLDRKISEIAGRFYGQPAERLSLIGVTGTNGKSSTVLLVAQILEALDEPCGVMGTLGNGRFGQLQRSINTTPDAISIQGQLRDWVDGGARWAAMEVSSHGLAQARVAGVQYRAAIFTNLTQDHLDYHGSMDAYAAAKAGLFSHQGLELAVLNADDAFSTELAGNTVATQVLTYSTQSKRADVYAETASFTHEGIHARVVTPWGQLQIEVPLLGEFNLGNLLAVVAVLGGLGVSVEQLEPVLDGLKPLPGRMECLRAHDGLLAVVDYAHTPDALEKVLRSLRPHCSGQLWCVFGCGGDRDAGKRPQMGAIAEQFADRVVITSDNPRSESAADIAAQIAAGMAVQPELIELDRSRAIESVLQQATADDVVLIAGKGHEDYQELGGERLPFSDVSCTRLALAVRGQS